MEQQPQVGMSIVERVSEASQVTKDCCDGKNLMPQLVVRFKHVAVATRIKSDWPRVLAICT